MKTGIHPTYYNSKVTCVCGAVFEFGSTVESYTVEICSQCHPFYTGKQKLIDTAGRIDKFKNRMKASEVMKAEELTRVKTSNKETAEEKVMRKVKEKEEAKAAEKLEKEEAKKKAAKKKAEKVIIKKSDSKK